MVYSETASGCLRVSFPRDTGRPAVVGLVGLDGTPSTILSCGSRHPRTFVTSGDRGHESTPGGATEAGDNLLAALSLLARQARGSDCVAASRIISVRP